MLRFYRGFRLVAEAGSSAYRVPMGISSFAAASRPQAYDQILVPRLFAPWARVLVDAVAPQPGEQVLDVATGTGVVARACAQRVGPSGRVLAIDHEDGMLALARQADVPEAAHIDYRRAEAAQLKVEDQSFDVVTCQQGLQFFSDRLAALREMHRALRARGRLAVAVWATLDECPIYRALHAIACEVLPRETAQLIELPFSFGGPDALKGALAQAGFLAVRVERRELPLVLEGGFAQALAVFQATPVGPAIAALPDEARVRMVAAAERHLSLLGEAGAVKAPMASHLALAVR